jgi:hypothetical protein
MPYRGDSPVEAWEYWFDKPPSETVQLALERHSKNHPAAATIIEAIEITSDKLDITDETKRLQYLNGVLRRKVLESVDPDCAEQERQIAIIRRAWDKSNLGFWPLSKRKILYWLEYCNVEEIKAIMRVAESWSDLGDEIERVIERRQQQVANGSS